MLNISNNKRRSLLKSEIIINIDFSEEAINKYRIYDNAVIVNINDKINIFSKRFSGINVNYYKIEIPEAYRFEGFQDEVIYESFVFGGKYKNINEKITKDKVEINKLIGNNGIIKKYEFL